MGPPMETEGLRGEAFSPPVPERPLRGAYQRRPPIVEGLPLVQLAQEAAPLLGLGVPRHQVAGPC